jgi:ABC-2 type transport system permease protein
MSSLTTYQTVSAIASFTVLFILTYIGGLWQKYAFIRDLTYFLSIRDRTEKMMMGLIRTKDILYYLVIIYMFVGFTLLKLSAQRRARPWYIQTARYLTIIVSGLLIGYMGSRPRLTGYLDATAQQINTIRRETQKNFSKLGDDELEVTTYSNIFEFLLRKGWFLPPKEYNSYLDTWEPYVRFKPDMTFKFEYFYYATPSDEQALHQMFPGKTLPQIVGITAKMLEMDSALFKSPQEIRRQNKDLDNYSGFASVIQLKYKGKKAFLRKIPPASGLINDQYGNGHESTINAAIHRLIGTKMPKIALVTGELERDMLKGGEREYSFQNADLEPLGFDFTIVNLARQDSVSDLTKLSAKDTSVDVATWMDKKASQDTSTSALSLFLAGGVIGSGITTVVLADPKVELSPVVLARLKSYLDNGGNMLILGEPKKQQILNPLLRQLGVQFMPGQLVQPSANETPDKIACYQTPAYFALSDKNTLRQAMYMWTHNGYAYFGDISRQLMKGVVPISYTSDSGFLIKPLLITKPLNKDPRDKVWLKADKLVTDSAAPVFNAQAGDLRQDSFATAIQLTRQIKGKEQRIIVCGDADFLANKNAPADPAEEMYSWLNDNRFPVYTFAPLYPADNKVTISPQRAEWQKIIYTWILPAIVLLLASVMLLRRKRK